jgi:hypothetical protein
MVSNVVQKSKTKFNLPKFQLPLTLQEILIIFAAAFSNNIILLYVNNQFLFYLMLAISFTFIWWSCGVLKEYTIKEKLTTTGKKETTYLSPNFITDLFFHLVGLTLALVMIAIFNKNHFYELDLYTMTFFSVGIKCMMRLNYYTFF